jgi:hypothetical protein
LENLFKIFSLSQRFYPVKTFLRRRWEKYFLNYHVAEILKISSDHFEISAHLKVRDLVHAPQFRGLMNEILKANKIYPTPKDIAVSIAIATEEYGDIEGKYIPNIIDLAFHLATEIKERISSDDTIKSILLDLSKNIDLFDIDITRAEIEKSFESKKHLFVDYFQTFIDLRFNYAIKVWHEGSEIDWVEWHEQDSITININPARIREGFFLVGFDYSIESSEERLMIATRQNGYEYFNGHVGKSADVIWAR